MFLKSVPEISHLTHKVYLSGRVSSEGFLAQGIFVSVIIIVTIIIVVVIIVIVIIDKVVISLRLWQHTLKLRLPTAFYHTELTETRDQAIDTEWNNE